MPQYQYGDNGPNTLTGTWYDDYIWGYGGNDTLIGDRGNDELLGEGGNDLFLGGLGADRLDGGANGSDTAAYKDSNAAVTVDLRTTDPQQGGTAAGDILISIENVTGSRFADTLIGNGVNNIFRGGAGADHIDGGSGHDRASYAYSAVAVDVDLTRTGLQTGGDAEGDTLISIERLTGSAYADHLVGNAKDNEFSGGAGSDVIDGGTGNDYVDYRGSTAVDINLTRAIQHGGHAEGDQLISIESVRGSTANDHIVGDANRNHLIGDAGDDYIDIGTAGATRIYDRADGGAGNDTINVNMTATTFATLLGGSGTDTLILHYIDPARDTYMPETATTTYFGYTYATGFEHVEAYGTESGDYLHGMSGTTDILVGAGGNDSISGGLGDYLDGGAGYDAATINYGEDYAGNVTADLNAGTATGIAGIVGFEEFTIVTGTGDDTVVSGNHRNYIQTGAGDDHVTVTGEFNYLNVGFGIDDYDTVVGSNSLDAITAGDQGHIDGGGGTYDSLTVTFLTDTGIVFEVDAAGNGGSNTGLTVLNVERFRLQSADHDDIYRTGDGDDVIYARGGNDRIESGGGPDELHGHDGNDILDGGAGNDTLEGGTGADTFYFSSGNDWIRDFSVTDGDILMIRPEFQGSNHGSFASLMSAAQETNDGLLLNDGNGSMVLLIGLEKADLAANAVEFLA